MAFDTTPPRNDYTGTGVLATYNFSFRIFTYTDLRVVIRDTAGVQTTLVYGVDFTATGVNVFTGGTITLTAGNLTTGYRLTIRFARTPQQTTDLRNQGGVYLEVLEDKFDELTRYVQALTDVVSRSLHLPETEVGSDALTQLPSVEERASKALWCNASGGIIASNAVVDSFPVSTFGATVIDDTNGSNMVLTIAANTTSETSPASGDFVLMQDISATAGRKATIGNMFKAVNQAIRKTADESVASSATLQNDNHLLLTLAASEEWVGTIYLSVGAAVNDTGFKLAITTPIGADILYTVQMFGNSSNRSMAGVGLSSGTAITYATADLVGLTNINVVVHFFVLVGVNAGTMQLQWAQATSHASNVTVRKGSVLFAQRVA